MPRALSFRRTSGFPEPTPYRVLSCLFTADCLPASFHEQPTQSPSLIFSQGILINERADDPPSHRSGAIGGANRGGMTLYLPPGRCGVSLSLADALRTPRGILSAHTSKIGRCVVVRQRGLMPLWVVARGCSVVIIECCFPRPCLGGNGILSGRSS